MSRRQVAGLGLLGAAAAVATTTPTAHATTSVEPAGHPPAGLDGNTVPATRSIPAGPTASYGIQKIRVGVQIKDGSYVPPGTTTAGTVITVSETGPSSQLSSEGGDCTTQASTQQPGSSETDCVYSDFGSTDYTASPGNTVTVTQKTVNAGLVIDSHPITIPPCIPSGGGSICSDTAIAVLTDPGIPPTAVADASHVRDGKSVVINVLGNDNRAGAPATLTVKTQPGHGSATVATATAQPAIRYRPKIGFHGTDAFNYTLHTANGTSTARVTITVARLPRPVANKDHARTVDNHSVRIHVLSNDLANGGGRLRIVKTSDPHHGKVIRHRHSVTYLPTPGYTGHDRFTYKIHNHGGSDTATVRVTVSRSD